MAEFQSKIRTIQWVDNISRMIDQTLLPYEYKNVDIKTGQEMYDAISDMIVRGAPAIGIAGAHGVALFAQEIQKEGLAYNEFVSKLIEKSKYLATSRPTAVNLILASARAVGTSTAPETLHSMSRSAPSPSPAILRAICVLSVLSASRNAL